MKTIRTTTTTAEADRTGMHFHIDDIDDERPGDSTGTGTISGAHTDLSPVSASGVGLPGEYLGDEGSATPTDQASVEVDPRHARSELPVGDVRDEPASQPVASEQPAPAFQGSGPRYRIEPAVEGWRALPTQDGGGERVFATRDEAVRWCRSIGVIPDEADLS
jgi:hypothetical protein